MPGYAAAAGARRAGGGHQRQPGQHHAAAEHAVPPRRGDVRQPVHAGRAAGGQGQQPTGQDRQDSRQGTAEKHL